MRTLIIPAIYLGALALLSACSPPSAPFQAAMPLMNQKADVPEYETYEQQTLQWITEDGGKQQFEFNPKVDILFVTDNSDSMQSAQENLVRNIDRFTSGIMKNKMIDYNIGTISVWENTDRYILANKGSYQIGELRHIKDAKGQKYDKRFVTKAQRSLLAASLNIGVAPLAAGGPQFEEVFSPLEAAINPNLSSNANKDFFREDAQLVIVLLTDADDASKNILPEEMAQKLINFKKGQADKVAVYGVLVQAEDPDSAKDWGLRIHENYHPECFDKSTKPAKNNGKCTKGFGPDRLEQFIIAANQNVGTPDQIRAKHIISILSPKFGDDLAKIGADITIKTLAKKIYLSQRPRLDKDGNLMVRVRYGNQVIPQKAKNGWLYDPEANAVYLSGEIAYNYVEGARFSVDLVPVNLKDQ